MTLKIHGIPSTASNEQEVWQLGTYKQSSISEEGKGQMRGEKVSWTMFEEGERFRY
mgnify:FL=1